MSTFSEEYLKFYVKRLRSSLKHHEILRRFLNSEISALTYEEIQKRLKNNTHKMRKAWERMTERLSAEVKEMEKTIRLLEIYQAKTEVEYAAGQLDEKTYKKKKETLEQGLYVLKNEAKKMKDLLEDTILPEATRLIKRPRTFSKVLPIERAFYFYIDYGQYAGRYARSLEELAEAIRNIEARSLRFHLVRGDFQSWIRDLGDPELALVLDGLKELSLDDEDLRNRIYESIKRRIDR